MRSRLAILLIIALTCWPVGALAAEAGASAGGEPAVAREAVESLHDVLLSCMKEAGELGFKGRYQRIFDHLDASFDLPFMARMSIASAWQKLSEEERGEFVDLSRRLSAANYADNFDGYGGERFETHSEKPGARGTIVVKTELVQSDGDNVEFDYRLRKVDDAWKIIDVQLDGKVSEITLRRADYRSTIDRKGFPKLVEALEKRIKELSED